MTIEQIRTRLFEMQDTAFRDFHARYVSTVNKDTIIGVRTPLLRNFARELYRAGEYREFLDDLPHKYYDENNLHGFIIERFKNYDECIAELERFLPYIDNWATCDSLYPRVFKRNKQKLLPNIYAWLKADKPYTVRYGIGMLMRLFLDSDFDEKYPELVCSVHTGDYYVSMMVAWYFATALAKQPDAILPYYERRVLPNPLHNKAIQKAVESTRVPAETKAYLKTLKW